MTTPKSAARAAQDSTAFRVIARIGYVVLGILHIVIGVIAISIATGGGGEADQGGALEQIQKTPAGVFLLWTIVIGLAALATGSRLARQPDASSSESEPEAQRRNAGGEDRQRRRQLLAVDQRDEDGHPEA